MKIDGNNLGGVSRESTAPKPGLHETAGAGNAQRAARLGYRNATEGASDAEPSSGTDQVDLSGLGQILSRLSQPDSAREAHIEKLATQYSEGQLEIDAAKVASKVVDDAFHSE